MSLDAQYGTCINIFKKYITKPVVVCGYGVRASLFMGVMAETSIPLLMVCDKTKAGMEYQYITEGKIQPYKSLKNLKGDFQIIITSELYYREIEEEVLRYVPQKSVVEINKIKKIYDAIPVCFQLVEPYAYRNYINSNEKRVQRVRRSFEDELSRQTFDSVIRMRSTWNEAYINKVRVPNMYFIPELCLGKNEIFLDGGAYDGDTVREFLTYTGGCFKKIYCVEPNIKNQPLFMELVNRYEYGKIEILPCGLSDKNTEMGFDGEATGYHISSRESGGIPVKTIDSLCKDLSFIKLDIQGEEMRALMGAQKTIRKNKPKLAVCVYHRMEDMLDITEWILSLNMGYQLLLRHHGKDINDTVLYAL